jgi:hypothetical protein
MLLTVEQQAYKDTLNTVAGDITQRILTATDENGDPKYIHMFDMWKAFLGGFVCAELAELETPTEEQKELLTAFTKDKITAMFEPKIVEKIVTVEVEKEVIKEVIKEVKVNVPTYAPAAQGGSATTFKRRAHSVNRPTEKERDLIASEREYMINKFNDLQRLIDKDSTECAGFVKYLNNIDLNAKPIYASQLAGYWSVLCKRVCGIGGDVAGYMANAIKYGNLRSGCPSPIASNAFRQAILENLMNNKTEAKNIALYQKIYSDLMAKMSSQNP